jgi:hypothetical protein
MRGWGDLMGNAGGPYRGGGGGGDDAANLAQMMMNGIQRGGGGRMMMMPTRRFEEQYHCYSVAYADKSHLEVCTLFILDSWECSGLFGFINT